MTLFEDEPYCLGCGGLAATEVSLVIPHATGVARGRGGACGPCLRRSLAVGAAFRAEVEGRTLTMTELVETFCRLDDATETAPW